MVSFFKLPLQQQQSQFVLDLFLNDPPQRPGAILGIIAVKRNLVLGLRRNIQIKFFIKQPGLKDL